MEINLFKSASNAVEVPVGAVLFREGDPGDVMYAVVSGTIELTQGANRFKDVGPGGIIGEMALIDAEPRSLTATAATPARVVPVDKQHFTFLVQEHPTFALQVMAVMAERLRERDRIS